MFKNIIKKNKIILGLLLVVMLVFAGANAFADNSSQEANTETKTETKQKETKANIQPRAAAIADLVGEARIAETNPYSGANFEMNILINSRSLGEETTDGIQGYTVSFKVPDNVDYVYINDNGLYTISPANPKSGDTVTIKFKDEVQMAKLQKITAVFKFKEGISTPSETFQPTITLSADNANGTTVQPPLVTAKNKDLPTIMTVTPDGENPTFVHTAKIKLKAEDVVGGLNHTDAKVKITFPADADIEYVRYNGTDYPITNVGGEQVVEIPYNDFKVGQSAEISLVYSYPHLTAPGTKDYQIKIDYTANRYGVNTPVAESKTIDETVSLYDGAGETGDYFSKTATNSIIRKSGEPVTFELDFHPVGDTKSASIIDDPERGVETDFFTGLKYESIRWNALPGNDPSYQSGIATKISYQTSTTGDTWTDAGAATTNGTLRISDLGLAAGQEVTKVKYTFSYNGSDEVPARAGTVRIIAFASAKDGITTTGTLDNGITNSAYLVGQKKGIQGSTYENIVDDGTSNLKTSQTNYLNSATCAFMTTNPRDTGDFTNNVFNPNTPSKIGEEFTHWLGIGNTGNTLFDAKYYITVPKTIEIRGVDFVNSKGNATYQILDSHPTLQTVVISFNKDMGQVWWNYGNEFQVRLRLAGLPGVNATENLVAWMSSGKGANQAYSGGIYSDNVANVGTVYYGGGCKQWQATKKFDVSLETTSSKTASTDNVDYAQTATKVVTNVSGETGWYAINAGNAGSSEVDITEARIIDMLPQIGDTMTITDNSKKSTLAPQVTGITMGDDSPVNLSNFDLYYSTNATAAENKKELEDFTASVATTWTAWDGTSNLPANAKAVKIVKKDGLAKGETLAMKLTVNLPYGVTGIKAAWNSISLGGEYGAGSYIVPGEPNKAGIYVSDTVADKKLAGTIWEDMNGNDLRDSGEPVKSGFTVRLFDWDDSLVATTTTDSNGYYEFNGLYPANYRVEYDNKVPYHMSKYKMGSDTTIDSNFTGVDGDEYIGTASVNLNTEPSPLNIDAGLYRNVSLGDYVWEDLNDDGLQNSNESGVAGVSVSLYRLDDAKAETLVGTKTTDSTGKYIFTDLKPGTFIIKVQQPTDYTPAKYAVGGLTATNNSKLQADWTSEEFVVQSNATKFDMDFGVTSLDPTGTIMLTKLDEENDPLAGAVFGIWASDKDPNTDPAIATATSDGNGKVVFSSIAMGEYKVKEITAPGGYVLLSTVFNATLEESNLSVDLGNVANTLIKGKVTLTKLNEENAALAGATFGIWKSTQDPATDTPLATATSATGTGLVEFTDLVPGSYKVKETVAPTGYVLSATVHTVTVPADGATASIGNVTNDLIKGKVTLTKLNEESNALAGATFGIWKSTQDPATDTPLATATSATGTGLVEFSDLLPGSYKVKETVAPNGYVLSTTVHTITVPADGATASIGNVTNDLIKGKVTLTKLNEESNALAGATFGIWKSTQDPATDTPLATATSATGTGLVEFTDLVPGSYKVKETVAPTGYVLSTTVHTITVPADGATASIGNVTNDLIKGKVTLTKLNEESNALAGATFGIWKSTQDPATDTPLATATSATGTGLVEFTDLVPGSYKIKETVAPNGYVLSTTVHDVTIPADGTTASIGNVTNTLIRANIEFNKVDEDLDPLAGATFGIWRNDQDPNVDAPLKTATSAAGSGKVVFTDMVEGTYKIKETIAPGGYNLITIVYPATVSGSSTVTIPDVVNSLTKGSILLVKEDEAGQPLEGVEFGLWESTQDPATDTPIATMESDSSGIISFTDLVPKTYLVKETKALTGYVVDNTVYTANITLTNLNIDLGSVENVLIKGKVTLTKLDEGNAALGGATFGIWKSTQDPSIDTPLATAVSATGTGLVEFSDLLPGTYKVKETIAPNGYVLSTTVHTITVPADGATANIGNVANTLIRGSVSLTKVDEADKALPGVEFGIWNSTQDPSTDTPIAKVKSDANGIVKFDNILPGAYKVKETQALSGYVVNTTVYDATVTLTALNANIGKVTNTLIRGDISLTKVDENNLPLANATFGIWKSTQNPKTDPAIATMTTAADGVIKFTGLLPGNYIIKETKAPNGYFLLSKEISAVTTNEKPTIDLGNVQNELILGDVSAVKVDKYGKKLQGVEFGVWKKGDDSSTVAPITTGTTDKDGNIKFTKLTIGEYYIQEIETIYGYIITKDKYDFKVDANNVDIKLGNILNNPYEATISLVKTDEDGNVLAGAEFGLYEKDSSKLIQKQTSAKNGKVQFTNVRLGEYTVKELKAPNGYKASTKVLSVKVTEDKLKIDLGVVENAKIPNPITGSTTLFVASILGVLSILGIGVSFKFRRAN